MKKLLFIFAFLAFNSAMADKNKTWQGNVLEALSLEGAQIVPCGGDVGDISISTIIDSVEESAVETLKVTGPFIRSVVIHAEDVTLNVDFESTEAGPVVKLDSLVCKAN